MFKDLTVSYYLISITGIIVLILLFAGSGYDILGVVFIFVWIFICALLYNIVANKRIEKIFKAVNSDCNAEVCLNRLYALYRGRITRKEDMIIAVFISQYLLHFGRYEQAINILKLYDPEKLIKFKSEAIYKYIYYNVLDVCCSRLGRIDEARFYFNKSEEIYNSPGFEMKPKVFHEKVNELRRLLLEDNAENVDRILSLLNELLAESETLLQTVSLRYTIADILIRSGRAEEAEEHIDFIRENGGDTIYTKCAIENNFTQNFILEWNRKPWIPTPHKQKSKCILASIIVMVCVTIVMIVFGIFTMKTIYREEYERYEYTETYTFYRDGNIKSIEIECYNRIGLLGTDIMQDSDFAILNDYDGCEAVLDYDKEYFKIYVDFDETPDNISDVLRFPATEAEFVDKEDSDCILLTHSIYKTFWEIEFFTGML